MLKGLNGTDLIKDIPDASVPTEDLTANSLRVLLWNHTTSPVSSDNWVRVCNIAAVCYADPTVALGTGAGTIPTGVTSTITWSEQFCFAFRKGGQTVYLGLSENANVPGVVSPVLATACTGAATDLDAGDTTPTTGYFIGNPVVPGNSYSNLTSGVVSDSTWGGATSAS